jgi:sporulation protein YlmC with PRC-barrel domain
MRTLSSLLRRDVVTQSGTKLGRCYDLRGELTATTLRVTALCVGHRGLLQRLGMPIQPKLTLVPWHLVSAIEGNRIVVRDTPIDERRR